MPKKQRGLEVAHRLGPPFGTMLRALRLRYCYCRSRNYFIRIQDVSEGWLVEFTPPVLKALTKGHGGMYRAVDDPEELFRLSPAMNAVKIVKRPFELLLDDAGELTEGTADAQRPAT